MKISLFAEYPLSIVYGGLELQLLKTFNALKKIGATVDLLDYHNLQDTDFDILHIFGNPPSMYETMFFAKKKKIIISAVCGMGKISLFRTIVYKGFSTIASMIKEQTNYSRLRFMFQSASHIICLNEHERKFISSRYNISLEKITIIPNGVENHFFNASGELFIKKYGIADFVLFTGNIARRKNPIRLARVLSQMGQKGVFIGKVSDAEAEYGEEFSKLISTSPNILWIKGLPYDSPLLASAYAAARVFCLPSFGETQSLSALEAMAAGTPVILGDLPYAYQTPFEKVLRCDPRDLKSIESCIRKALEDPEKYSNRLSINYTWENIAKEIVRVYEKVINYYGGIL
jgi:glycosyltransferase involved in cell wall biosynthesis